MKRIAAICGSTRASSTNLNLINAIAELACEKFDVILVEGLSDIPHFNPDLDNENAPEQVTAFRNTLRAVNGILICTPEYAMGVPGTLKNALDWTVSSMEFSKKPVALITASSLGEKAHASLLETLKIIESEIPESMQLLISNVQTKINPESIITDQVTHEKVRSLMFSLISFIKQPAQDAKN